MRDILNELEQVRKERDEARVALEQWTKSYDNHCFVVEERDAALARVKALEDAIRTHSRGNAFCRDCGGSTPCADDDVCSALLRPQDPGTPETRGTKHNPGPSDLAGMYICRTCHADLAWDDLGNVCPGKCVNGFHDHKPVPEARDSGCGCEHAKRVHFRADKTMECFDCGDEHPFPLPCDLDVAVRNAALEEASQKAETATQFMYGPEEMARLRDSLVKHIAGEIRALKTKPPAPDPRDAEIARLREALASTSKRVVIGTHDSGLCWCDATPPWKQSHGSFCNSLRAALSESPLFLSSKDMPLKHIYVVIHVTENGGRIARRELARFEDVQEAIAFAKLPNSDLLQGYVHVEIYENV